MKYLLPLLLIFCFCTLKAQITPLPSPAATFSQTIGVTELFMEYSRPSIKGRKVFGELIPFQKIWRTGANASTKLELSTNAEINGVNINAGVYALMSRPGLTSWEIYLFSDLDVTEETFVNKFPNYTLTAVPKKCEFTETLIFYVSDIKDDKAKLHLNWESTEIVLEISVNTISPVEELITFKNDEMAGSFQQSAEYFLQKNENLELALEYIDKSIFLRQTFRNTWTKAQLLYTTKKYKEALIFAKKAKELGNNDPVYTFFSQTIDDTIMDLQKKTL